MRALLDRVRPRWDPLVVLAIVAVALWHNLGGVRDAPFHPDESRWLNRAHYVADLADPFGPTWDDGYLTRGQPPLGSYLMGLGLALQGRDLATNGVWHFHEGVAWNAARGRMADADDLIAGRRTNAAVGALAVGVAYLLGARLTNRVGGVAGAAVLAAHPLHGLVAAQALSDQLLVLLVGLAALAACRLAARPSWRAALLLGALLGLGGATKLSPLLLTLPLAGLGVALLAREPRQFDAPAARLDRQVGRRLLAVPAIAVVVFVAVYPYLWPDPIERTANLFEFRSEEMEIQSSMWPDVAVDGPLGAIGRIGSALGERYTVTDRAVEALVGALGLAWRPRWSDVVLALAGAAGLVGLAVRRGPRSPQALTLLVLGGEVGLIVLAMGSDFYRYHLPVAFVAAVCVGVGVGLAWSPVRRWASARVRSGNPAESAPALPAADGTALPAG